jgi:hypothetical protein
MPASKTHNTKSTGQSAKPNLCADLAGIARSAATGPAFLTHALQTIATAFASPYAALYARRASSVIEQEWHTGPTDPAFWKPTLQAFLTESMSVGNVRATLLNPKRGDTKYALLFTPITDAGGGTIGGIAMVTTCRDQDHAAGRLAALEAATGMISAAVDLVETRRSGSTSAPKQATAHAGGVTTPEELAFSITNNLRNKLGCEQVALGMVHHRRMVVLSISGLDDVSRQSPGVVHLRGAMEECLDADSPLVCQAEQGWDAERMTDGHRLHRQWHGAAKGDAVASIPLKADDKTVAVLSLRRRADQPFKPALLEEVRQRVEPYAPTLLLTRRASRGLLGHAVDTLVETVGRLTRRERHGPKVIAGALVLTLLWFIFGTGVYNLTVPCTVAPRQLRHVSAPNDGVLVATSVIAGDTVRRGDVLAELDRRELEQERAVLRARLAVLEHEQDRARAEESPVEVQLALAQATLTRAQLDIVESKIRRAVIRAPIDGVIVAGDLRPRIGGVLAQGDPMFAVAPHEGWTVELEVPEADADELTDGLTGGFSPYARPEQAQALRINRVRPTAEVPNDKNVFIAEADVDHLPFTWMRPGMEGTAKIHVGERPIWWLVLHRGIDFVRLHLWL